MFSCVFCSLGITDLKVALCTGMLISILYLNNIQIKRKKGTQTFKNQINKTPKTPASIASFQNLVQLVISLVTTMKYQDSHLVQYRAP